MLNYKQIWHGIKPIRWLNKFNLTWFLPQQRTIWSNMTNNTTKVTSRHKNFVGSMTNLFGAVMGPKYDGKYLRSLTDGLLGNLTLKQTFCFGLQIYHSHNHSLQAFLDADWVGCHDDRCSIGGFLHFFLC